MKFEKEERGKKGALISAMIMITLLISIFLFSFSFQNARADIFMGTCEGYVKWANNTVVPGASVSVTVSGCTSPPANCIRNATTGSNGYYVIANLNLPPYGNVSGTAVKGSNYGTNTAQADAYQAAFMNITLCESPSQAAVVPVADSHDPDITFWLNWTSGSSPYSTFDQLYWTSSWTNKSSPQNKTSLSFAIHTWGARTCLSSQTTCCSEPAYDSFEVYNTPPCEPILEDQPDTINTTVTLNWSSNTVFPCPDADNDTTYYNFKIDGNVTTNETPTVTVSGLGYGPHTWGVQECDDWECSDWATDDFDVYNNPCPSPNLTIQDDTCTGIVTLSWTSNATDPDGDACHDEFDFNGTIINPATSPQTETLTDTDLYEWAVRSCDPFGGCSPWNESSFIYCACNGTGGGGGGGGGAEQPPGGVCILTPGGYELTIIVPKELYPGQDFELKTKLRYSTNISNLKIVAETPQEIKINLSDYGYVDSNEEINFILKGSSSHNMKDGKYPVSLKFYDNNKLIINHPVELNFVMPSPLMILNIIKEYPFSPLSLILLSLLLIIIIIVIIWLVTKFHKKYKARKQTTKALGKIRSAV